MRAAVVLPFLLLAGCHGLGSSRTCGPEACGDAGAVCGVNGCEANCSGPESWCGHCIRHSKYFRPWDNLMTNKAARCAAKLQLHERRDPCSRNTDYCEGYEQAFVDVSRGADGTVPAVPPPYYWSRCARTPEGHQKAQNWFAGYAAGAPAAMCYYGPYLKVADSGSSGYPPGGFESATTNVPDYGWAGNAGCPPSHP